MGRPRSTSWPRGWPSALARTAIDGQQNDQPFDGAAKANLWGPTDSDHDEGAHGMFDSEGKRRSEQAWLSRHRREIGLSGAGVAVAAAGSWLSRRRP